MVPSGAVNLKSINSVRIIWIKVGTILLESSQIRFMNGVFSEFSDLTLEHAGFFLYNGHSHKLFADVVSS